ncbi:hypothetical protein Tco_1323069, partial [Tanacetum coccineum]
MRIGGASEERGGVVAAYMHNRLIMIESAMEGENIVEGGVWEEVVRLWMETMNYSAEKTHGNQTKMDGEDLSL